jgi:hypothetical protein
MKHDIEYSSRAQSIWISTRCGSQSHFIKEVEACAGHRTGAVINPSWIFMLVFPLNAAARHKVFVVPYD